MTIKMVEQAFEIFCNIISNEAVKAHNLKKYPIK